MQVVKRDIKTRQGTITVQAATQEEATSPEARNLALQDAQAQGLQRAGISSHGGAYPVDANGNSNDAVMRAEVPTAGYRCDFVVTAGL